MKHASWFVVLALTSGCEFWSTVTVPAVDTTPPVAATRLLEIGGAGYDDLGFGDYDGASLTTSNPNRKFMLIAAAWDPEGARKVTMSRHFVRQCVNVNTGIGALQNFSYPQEVYTQPGGPGSVVDDGVWTGVYVDLRDWLTCPGSTSFDWGMMTWTVVAENYSGLTAIHGTGTLVLNLP